MFVSIFRTGDRGNVVGQGPTLNQLVREFDYDPLYRLILATGREDTNHSHNLIWQDTSPVAPTPANSREYRRTYQYDKMGNILKLAHTAHQATFTRNFGYHSSMQHNKLIEVLDNSQNTLTDFLYDAAGNSIQNNSERFYIWDAANQLKQFKIDDGQTVSVYGQYLYSGGQRVKKLVKDQQGNYTITVYIDGVFEYQKLVKGANTYERNYTHIMDDRSRIATVRAGSDEDDISEDAFYVVEDHLNSSAARLKATDSGVIDREESYPFGETSLHNFSKKRYRYTGKEKDSESGLYYYGARYYSAWCCRFISIDPLTSDFSHLSPYNYAGNKPITARDINGMNGENEEISTKNNLSASSTLEAKWSDKTLEESVTNLPATHNTKDGHWTDHLVDLNGSISSNTEKSEKYQNNPKPVDLSSDDPEVLFYSILEGLQNARSARNESVENFEMDPETGQIWYPEIGSLSDFFDLESMRESKFYKGSGSLYGGTAKLEFEFKGVEMEFRLKVEEFEEGKSISDVQPIEVGRMSSRYISENFTPSQYNPGHTMQLSYQIQVGDTKFGAGLFTNDQKIFDNTIIKSIESKQRLNVPLPKNNR